MKRFHLFEFADQSWCPNLIRRGVTEYLATAINLRTYDVDEMRAMTASLTEYDWDIRFLKGQTQTLPSLVGTPKSH